jgi:hypothetical protein
MFWDHDGRLSVSALVHGLELKICLFYGIDWRRDKNTIIAWIDKMLADAIEVSPLIASILAGLLRRFFNQEGDEAGRGSSAQRQHARKLPKRQFWYILSFGVVQ